MMLRHLIYSIIGHIVVLALFVFPAFLEAKPRKNPVVYSVRAVSTADVETLLNKAAPQGEPKPKLPQVQVKKDRELPKKNWRPRQTVKKSSRQSGKSTDVKKNNKSGKTPVSGIQVDSEFDYPDYILSLRSKIERNWRPPTMQASLKTRVYFKIAGDGRILRTFIENRTGAMAFDMSAMNAVTKSAPFDPLPAGFPGQDIGIHMDFIYEP
ncbi:MAG: TonB C-terminal domain-containing protein [Candidatus Latescibacteria bacterium]|nr:TonB C-terminal domain-containing protein [Candidatus Latescibacterota bacterium]